MNYRFIRALVVALLFVAAFGAVGSYTYHLGVVNGMAESGRLAVPNGTPVVAIWPRPWGFGFGFFPIFPLLFFLFFWVLVARALFWRGRWHRGYGNRWETRGVPPMFEEWHRRMHEQQPQQPPPAARS